MFCFMSPGTQKVEVTKTLHLQNRGAVPARTQIALFTQRRTFHTLCFSHFHVPYFSPSQLCAAFSCFTFSTPSVLCMRVLWQNQTMDRYFDITRKGIHSSFLTQTAVAARGPFRLEFALKVTYPFEKNADFDRFPLITSQP